jgi:hypothetical protein
MAFPTLQSYKMMRENSLVATITAVDIIPEGTLTLLFSEQIDIFKASYQAVS